MVHSFRPNVQVSWNVTNKKALGILIRNHGKGPFKILKVKRADQKGYKDGSKPPHHQQIIIERKDKPKSNWISGTFFKPIET